jgi:hypothetical protein
MNGIRGSLLYLLLAAVPVFAQPPPSREPPSFVPGLDAPWQPPRTDLDDRPNVAPRGYAFYGRVDYLLWWTEKDRNVAPSATSGAAGTTTTAFGEGTNFGALVHSGTQGILGYWLDPQQTYGVEAGGFWLSNRYPGWRGGIDGVGVHNQLASHLWGAEADARCEILRRTYLHLDILGGFRHLSLDESLSIAERDAADGVISSDRFGTRNRFFGGELGLDMDIHSGPWSLDLYGKAALGADCTRVNANGTTLVAGQAHLGGLVVSAAHSGHWDRDVFAVVPEFGINGAFELMSNLRITAGYAFLYLSDAARPAEQADALRRAGQAAFPAKTSDFWAQGLTVGLEFRF